MPKISKQDPNLELKKLVNSRISLYYQNETLLKARAQAQHELNIIKNLGWSEYFLIVNDYVTWALINNIPKGFGRGAAPASIVNYILGITAVDPLSHGLIFERFLNSERISAPNIYIDFCYKRHDEIIQHFLPSSSFLKSNILGLRALTIIDQCERYIRQNNNNNFCIKNIPSDDKQTYTLLQKGQTIGCFQLESAGIRKLLRKMNPDRFADIPAILAMYRPGPLAAGMADDYIARKHDKTKYKLPFPELKPYLDETYGLILYQEQLMQIANIIGGFNMTEANNLQRALGRKRHVLIAEFKKQFLSNALQKGFAKKETELLFKECVRYAEYSFTKAHAVAYGMLSYQTAYLKANYPTEYMAAILDVLHMLTPELEKELFRMGICLDNSGAYELLRNWASIDSCIKIIPQGNNIMVDYEL